MDGDLGDLAEFGKKRNTDFDFPPPLNVGGKWWLQTLKMLMSKRKTKQDLTVILEHFLSIIIEKRGAIQRVFLAGAFEEKCPTLTGDSFFIRVRSIFWSFVQQLELRKFKTLENSEPRPKQKKQNRRPEPRKIPKIDPLWLSWCFSLSFFGTRRLFIVENFWIVPKGTPFNCFDNFATEWMLQNPEGSRFSHFSVLWHCSKISFFDFSPNYFYCPFDNFKNLEI